PVWNPFILRESWVCLRICAPCFGLVARRARTICLQSPVGSSDRTSVPLQCDVLFLLAIPKEDAWQFRLARNHTRLFSGLSDGSLMARGHGLVRFGSRSTGVVRTLPWLVHPRVIHCAG